MLDEKQQNAKVELIAADVVVCLQIIQRLVNAGAIQDQELAAVGTTRNHLVEGMQAATGVNFDLTRAAQARAQQEAQAKAQAARQAQTEAPAPAPALAPVVEAEVAPTAEEDAEAPAEA